jgi:excisionase family DNA binding protein
MNITPRQVATRFSISVPTVYRWVREGKLPAVRLGKRVLRFSEIDLIEWENFKLAHDRAQSSQADESGGSAVLPGSRTDAGPGQGSTHPQAKRNQRAKSLFAIDDATSDPVR